MNYKNIKIQKKHDFATNEPNESDLQEILDALNKGDFTARTEFPSENHPYKEPCLTYEDHCHATARKFSESNQTLKVVSGYLITCQTDRVTLQSHSVVRDIKTNTIWELMAPMYPLDKHKFIEHSPEIRGYDLIAECCNHNCQ